MNLKYILLFFVLCWGTTTALGQCPTGEIEVEIEVHTDQYAYELYWELVPSGDPCGSANLLFSGGNNAVGCTGGGSQSQTPGGYANNATITEGPWCLTETADFDIKAIDDWGDGGIEFVVLIDGFPIYTFETGGANETFTFTASGPPALDAALDHISTNLFSDIAPINISTNLVNLGSTAITDLTLNYSIDNGATVSEALSGLNIAPFNELELTHGTPWIPSSAGGYALKVWITDVNGGTGDFDPSNDELTTVITLRAPKPDILGSYLQQGNNLAYNEIASAQNQVNNPQDLDFHPNGTDLWVVNKGTENSGGSTVTISDAGQSGQSAVWKQDGNAWHFMSLPSGIAFSDNGNFCTSTAVFDANHNGGQPFTGPALWSSDPAIYAQPSGGNGSHLDMLHQSPHCMGVAGEGDNVFWVYDAYNKDIVRYDFVDDHGPGNDDHADAIVYRFPGMGLDWINQDMPSHLAFDDDKDWLYFVDGGNGRVVRLDVNSGNPSGTPSFGPFEPLAQYSNISGATWEVVADTDLGEPVGIDVLGDHMIVSDNQSGDIIFFDITAIPATEVGRLTTGAQGIMGITIGYDGLIWYVDAAAHKVVHIVPDDLIPTSLPTEEAIQSVKVYPNPAEELVRVDWSDNDAQATGFQITDLAGKTVMSEQQFKSVQTIDVSSLPSGIYLLRLEGKDHRSVHKLVKK